MRTTVTLDPDVEARLRRLMADRGIGFKEALNEALRQALAGAPAARPYRLAPRRMGQPLLPLDKALEVAAAMEDEEVLRKMTLRK